jgi:hypothetical protein
MLLGMSVPVGVTTPAVADAGSVKRLSRMAS